MTELVTPNSSTTTPGRFGESSDDLNLRAHGPGYSVIQECLRLQGEAQPRTGGQRFRGRSPLHPDALSWYQGALGEIEVGRVLEKLGPEWTVLHAVPVGSGESDIDHLVVGPGGVFSLNTKHHSGKKVWAGGGKLLVNGHAQDHVRNSQFEGRRASKLLSATALPADAAGASVSVQPVIVVVGASSIVYGTKKAPVVPVVSSRQLVGWLRRRPAVLSAPAIAALSAIASSRGTWHSEAVVITDTLRHEQRFARLRAEVDDARRRARAFQVLVGLAVFGLPVGGLAVAVAILHPF